MNSPRVNETATVGNTRKKVPREKNYSNPKSGSPIDQAIADRRSPNFPVNESRTNTLNDGRNSTRTNINLDHTLNNGTRVQLYIADITKLE